MPWWSTNYTEIGKRGQPVHRGESADVAAGNRREEMIARGAATARNRRIKQWKKDVASAQAAVIKLEAIPAAKRNRRELRKAKNRLRDLKKGHG